MRRLLSLSALAAVLCARPALAQVADAGGSAPDAEAMAGADAGAALEPASPANLAELRTQLLLELQAKVQADEDQKLNKMRDELKDEIRAEMTTAQAPPQEFEELPEEKPKLQLFELHGYFRLRPTLFENMQLGWTQADPNGYYLFPKPQSNTSGKTELSSDLRFRVEPILNVTENIRLMGQIDVLDNLVLGSTPDLSAGAPLTVLTQGQVPPSTLMGNLQQSSLQAKRVWAEVAIPPVGQLRFGRMGNHWGLGMYQNDGNCLDCDYGNTVDRIALALKVANHYIIPMMDWVGAGPLYNTFAGDQLGQPVSYDRLLEAYQYGIQVVRRDTDEELKALEQRGKPSINYGFFGTLRNQADDLMWNGSTGYGAINVANGTACPAPSALTPGALGAGNLGVGVANPNSALFNSPETGLANVICGIDARNATFVVPDVWFRYKTRRLRLESELVYVNGNFTINPDPDNPLDKDDVNHKIFESSFGGAFEGDYKFLSDLALKVGFDAGLATGNHAYGFGAQPGRTSPFASGTGPNGGVSQGSIDGNPISCTNSTEPCARSTVNAFSFSPDYRVDMILWRQLLGSVTDAFYLKPSVSYEFVPGLDASFAAIYSQAMVGNLTPGGQAPLGIELDAGIHYKSQDGFIASLDYGLLVPLPGLSETTGDGIVIGTSVAQAFRLFLGVKY